MIQSGNSNRDGQNLVLIFGELRHLSAFIRFLKNYNAYQFPMITFNVFVSPPKFDLISKQCDISPRNCGVTVGELHVKFTPESSNYLKLHCPNSRLD